jgi:hypothetical protein
MAKFLGKKPQAARPRQYLRMRCSIKPTRAPVSFSNSFGEARGKLILSIRTLSLR